MINLCPFDLLKSITVNYKLNTEGQSPTCKAAALSLLVYIFKFFCLLIMDLLYNYINIQHKALK